MSIFNPCKPKIKQIKPLYTSSKSTRATSKNIIAIKNKKLYDKVEYSDLYSDLITTRQNFQYTFQKKYTKVDSEDSQNNFNNTLFSQEKFAFNKIKKPYSQKKIKINTIKYFKEDGNISNFPLYKENEIKLNEYDDKVKIESAEDDFESDESTLEYGRKKVEKDLIEAFATIQKERISCLVNYKKYRNLIKKTKKRLSLTKNLPYIKL